MMGIHGTESETIFVDKQTIICLCYLLSLYQLGCSLYVLELIGLVSMFLKVVRYMLNTYVEVWMMDHEHNHLYQELSALTN